MICQQTGKPFHCLLIVSSSNPNQVPTKDLYLKGAISAFCGEGIIEKLWVICLLNVLQPGNAEFHAGLNMAGVVRARTSQLLTFVFCRPGSIVTDPFGSL